MKAIFLVRNGNPDTAFEVRETPQPIPGKGDVLIKVEAFGLNYADVMARNGLYRDAPTKPFVPGYEAVGTIVGVGAEVPERHIGKRVVAFTRFGGYSEFVVSALSGIGEIESLDAAKACALATQYVTAWYMTEYFGPIRKGDKVLIHSAAGGVGTALLQICRNKGCEIFANCGSDDKFDYVRRQGAMHVFNYRSGNYEVWLKSLLKGSALDVTFNAVGGKTFKQDFRLLGPGGRLMLFGGAARSGKRGGFFSTLAFVWRMGLVLPIGLMMRSKSLVGVNMLKIADHKPEILGECLRNVVREVLEGRLDPHSGGKYSVENIADAHRVLESSKTLGKIIVYWPVK